jgi:hypothetical protein
MKVTGRAAEAVEKLHAELVKEVEEMALEQRAIRRIELGVGRRRTKLAPATQAHRDSSPHERASPRGT